MGLEWPTYVSLLIDLTIPFALLVDISIYITFGSKNSKLCPIFLSSMRNMFLCNIEIYLVEIFIKEPANLGLFRDFYVTNGWWIGKLAYATLTAVGYTVNLFAAVIGVSRVLCVATPLFYKKISNRRVVFYISLLVVGFMVTLVLHVFIFVDCRAFSKSNSSLAFNSVHPSIVHTLMATYGNGLFQLIVIVSYALLGFMLWSTHKRDPRFKGEIWTKENKRIVISQILIVFPKMVATGHIIYAQVEAFNQDLHLTPLNLDYYFLILKIGAVGYGIYASIIILFCFPKTWVKLKEQFAYFCLSKTKASKFLKSRTVEVKDSTPAITNKSSTIVAVSK